MSHEELGEARGRRGSPGKPKEAMKSREAQGSHGKSMEPGEDPWGALELPLCL